MKIDTLINILIHLYVIAKRWSLAAVLDKSCSSASSVSVESKSAVQNLNSKFLAMHVEANELKNLVFTTCDVFECKV